MQAALHDLPEKRISRLKIDVIGMTENLPLIRIISAFSELSQSQWKTSKTDVIISLKKPISFAPKNSLPAVFSHQIPSSLILS
jgi:hypothetical protein